MNRACPKCGDPATHIVEGVGYCDFHPAPEATPQVTTICSRHIRLCGIWIRYYRKAF